ncbi:hypothetical protein Tco_0084269 [Tanacetum coccineum]
MDIGTLCRETISFIYNLVRVSILSVAMVGIQCADLEYKPTNVEEKQDMRNKMKARGTLLMALPNKDQLKFHSYKDAKFLMETIEKSSETMDQTFDRLQKLISQLEIQGEVISQEDMNLKLLRSLPSKWKTHALIWRNKEEIETISLDDLYNNLKIYEPEIIGSSSIRQNPQSVAFVSSISTNNNSSTNEADNTAYRVSTAHTQSNAVNSTSVYNLSDAVICAFLVSQPNSPQLAQEDLEQIHPDDLEDIDLQWEMAMMTIRARRFIKRTGRTSSTAASPAVEIFVNSSKMLENQEYNKSKSDKGYHVVPLPYTGNFIPFKPDLMFMDEIVESKNLDVTIVVTPSNVNKVESNHKSANVKSNGDVVEPKTVKKNSFRPPVIEDWNSDDESEVEIIHKDKTVSSSTEKIKFVKSARETVEKVETSKKTNTILEGTKETGTTLCPKD